MWRRLGRMEPIEVAHRLVEQLKRLSDRFKRGSWSAFGDFPGEVSALPGFQVSFVNGACADRLAVEVQAAIDGRFAFFDKPYLGGMG